MLRPVWAFPLVAALIALWFSVLLLRAYLDRRRPAELLWALALLMYAGASIALLLGVLDGWSPAEYRVYWLFGAVLNVPYLAMGELYLLVRDRRVRTVVLVLLLFATAFAVARVRTATLDAAALGVDLPRGSHVWADDPVALDLARFCAATRSCVTGSSERSRSRSVRPSSPPGPRSRRPATPSGSR